MSVYKPPIHSYNVYRNVLGEGALEAVFTQENITFIQKKTRDLLRGVHPEGKEICVAEKVIIGALDTVVQNYSPSTGDIYGRYNVSSEPMIFYVRDVIDQTINFIVSNIRNEYEVIKNNFDLTIWDSLKGDFNRKGLMPHDKIKIRLTRPDPMQFNMNY